MAISEMTAPPRAATTLETENRYLKAKEFIRRNNFGEAEELLEWVVRTSPDNSKYLSLLGVCYAYGSERFAAAEKLCRKALILSPQDAEILCSLGRVLKLMGHRQEAYEIFLRAYQIDPQHPVAAAELIKLGVRRKAVLPFLARSHPINRLLGRARHALWRARG